MNTCKKIIATDIRGNIEGREERHTFPDGVKRCHLITKRDCYNLRYKQRQSQQRHSEDPLSVDTMVKELMQEAYDPV
jgi:hypothetical protein